MARSVTITFRTTKELRDALKRIADSEHRPVANFVEKVLLDYVARHPARETGPSRNQK